MDEYFPNDIHAVLITANEEEGKDEQEEGDDIEEEDDADVELEDFNWTQPMSCEGTK